MVLSILIFCNIICWAAMSLYLLRQGGLQDTALSKHLKEAEISILSKIDSLKDSTSELKKEAFQLNHTLRGSSTAQGAWGEMMLSSLLDSSGMREGHEYHLQYDAGDARPDAVITLPQGSKVIVDAKVSLTHYAKIYESISEAEAQTWRRKHMLSMKTHLTTLSKKKYAEKVEGSFESIVMFTPIESAYIEALRYDADLLNTAFDHNVIIVGPSGLFAILKTYTRFWREKRVHDHTKHILKYNRKLESRLQDLIQDLQSMNKSLGVMQRKNDKMLRLLQAGNNSILDCINLMDLNQDDSGER